jgi:hypothetical protein
MSKKASTKPSARVKAKPAADFAQSARLIVKDVAARIQEVRDRQRVEGNFDCYGRAGEGYCDQGDCLFRDECLEISNPALAVVPVGRKR